MARNSRRGGSRRARTGGSTYARPSTESISVLRLYAKDFNSTDFDAMSADTIKSILGFNAAAKFRLIAVCFGGVPGYNSTTQSVNAASSTVSLEFSGSGSNFAINQTSGKPVRVRVPRSDVITGQWWTVGSDGTVTPTVNGSVGNTDNLFFVRGSNVEGSGTQYVQFIDVAIRF